MHRTVVVFLSNPKGSWTGGRAAATDGPESTPDSKRLKVLVVDDERDLADLTVELLRTYRVDALAAYSGRHALRLLQDDITITAVFSDVMMPEMTGLDLARVIADRYPRVSVLLTSGYMFPEVLSEDNRFVSFVRKPYRIETVLALLRDAPSSQ
jgi:CheY-like chemotaxis protein